MSRRVEIAVDGRTISLSSPDKQLVRGVTKQAIAEHWLLAGPLTLAAVGRRLVSAKRVPDGPGGEVFFQKNKPAGMPRWVATARVPSRSSEDGHTDHVVLVDVPHLVALTQFGTVEVHVSTWDVDDPLRPRELVLDLDPPADAAVDDVRRALRRTLALLDDLDLPWLVKTTGSKGFHVHVPVTGVDQDRTRDLAAAIGSELTTRHPRELTTEFHKADRRGRVLVDWWRNSSGATAIAPWSPRVAPGAPVATPLRRADVEGRLDDIDPAGVTVADVPALLDDHGDPWAERPDDADEARLAEAARALADS